MQTYRIQATISEDGTLLINNLPFQAGDEVEVVVRSRGAEFAEPNRYPLRGTPIKYLHPLESVAENEE